MRARRLFEGSAFGPEKLGTIFRAFDAAWNDSAGACGNDPQVIEAARRRLANLVLSLVQDGDDPEQLKTAALQAMKHTYETLPQGVASTEAASNGVAVAHPGDLPVSLEIGEVGAHAPRWVGRLARAAK